MAAGQLDQIVKRRGLPATGEFMLLFGLIALDVVVRLLPNALNFTPVAASALFAGAVLGRPLALAVPLAAMALGDCVLGFDDWRVMIFVYAGLTLPAVLGLLTRGSWKPIRLASLAALSSVIFFVTSNFAVWMFSGIYARDIAGLVKCYIAALPFFQNTLMGDLFWTAVLFGGLWVARHALGSRQAQVPAV
ncbi:MAG TPA: DUF6580 family putative transport protein [Bradyrhizobium sp.]|nr:DUF6580 family putative transport protein [Bradyrhizobium sp.]